MGNVREVVGVSWWARLAVLAGEVAALLGDLPVGVTREAALLGVAEALAEAGVVLPAVGDDAT